MGANVHPVQPCVYADQPGNSLATYEWHMTGLTSTCRSNLLIVTKKEKIRLEPLTDEEKQDRRDNWLAPAGSVQEKKFLRRWAERKGLSEADRELIREWHKTPDGFEKRNFGFWRAAKASVLGDVVYETAMERHQKLPRGREWEVACLTAEGYEGGEIADLLGVGERTVDNIVLKIKQIIVQEFDCEIESVNIAQISRWFLGL